MTHKDFDVSVKESLKETNLTFSLHSENFPDEFVYRVKSPIKVSAIAYSLLRLEEFQKNGVYNLSSIRNTLLKVFTEESVKSIIDRLCDEEMKDDPLEFSDITRVIRWVIEEIGGHPTESSSD